MLSSLFCLFCSAWLTVHGPSYHTSPGYNNDNYGLGVSVETENKLYSFSTGVYKNSYDNSSVYLVGSVYPWEYNSWRFGGTLGIASGYNQETGTPLIGFGVAEYSLSKKVRVLFIGLPPVGELSGVISFLIQLRIK